MQKVQSRKECEMKKDPRCKNGVEKVCRDCENQKKKKIYEKNSRTKKGSSRKRSERRSTGTSIKTKSTRRKGSRERKKKMIFLPAKYAKCL